MRKLLPLLMLCAFCALIPFTGVRAEDAKAKEFAEKLAKKMGESKSAEMDMEMSGAGIPAPMKAHYTGIPAKKLFSMDMVLNAQGMTVNMHNVCDGTIIWTEMKMPGMVMVTKTDLKDATGKPGEKDPLDSKTLTEDYEFTALKDDKVDDEPVTVLEGKFKPGKQPEGMKAEGTRFYISKKDEFLRKIEQFDKDGKAVSSIKMSNIKLDAKLDEASYKYTPPAGAQVIDAKALKGFGGGLPGQ